MNFDNLSRQQLLSGLFACSLLGWLFLHRKKTQATPLPPAPVRAPAASAGRMSTVTTYVDDANNERVGEPVTRQLLGSATVCTCEFDGHMTTFTFWEVTP